MDLPVTQFRTKAEQAFLDQFVAAEKALTGQQASDDLLGAAWRAR